jgi:hypothetical protein
MLGQLLSQVRGDLAFLGFILGAIGFAVGMLVLYLLLKKSPVILLVLLAVAAGTVTGRLFAEAGLGGAVAFARDSPATVLHRARDPAPGQHDETAPHDGRLLARPTRYWPVRAIVPVRHTAS